MELPHLSLLLFLISPLRCTLVPHNSPPRGCLHEHLAASSGCSTSHLAQPAFHLGVEHAHGKLKHYNIHLDLGDFDIVENHKQRFQGQEMTIFYRDRLGKYPYLSRDGRKVNGGLPQLGDLATHLSLTVTQLSDLLRPDFSGLAVIDWEEWRPLWGTNFGPKMEYRRLSKRLVKQERPDLSEQAVAALARQMFEEHAQRFMEETLQSAVRERPKGLWGFYGFPTFFNEHKRKTDKS